MSISLPKEIVSTQDCYKNTWAQTWRANSRVECTNNTVSLHFIIILYVTFFCILLNFAFTVYSKELTNYTITRVHYTTVHHYTRLPKDVHMYITHHNALVSTLQVLKWITDLCFGPV